MFVSPGSRIFAGSRNASAFLRGLVQPARLGSGAANNTTFLRGDRSYAAPVTGLAGSKSKSITRDFSSASGSVAYTGVGFQPSVLYFFAPSNVAAFWGWSDASKSGVSISFDGTSGNIFTSNNAYAFSGGGTNDPTVLGQTCTVSSYDSDGFTLSWVKHGAPGAFLFTIVMWCLK